MNYQTIQYYLQLYKDNFHRIDDQELYKWKAIKHFKDQWDIEAVDFAGMVTSAFKKVQNLMASGNYYPRRMLRSNAEVNPEKVRKLFKELFDEKSSVLERIANFRTQFDALNDQNFNGYISYQDPRAVMVYLTLRYPENYYFYKYEMVKSFMHEVDYPYTPVKGKEENVSEFLKLCKQLKPILIADDALLKLHHNRLDASCYQDPNYTVLTQDFIYAVVRHLQEEKLQEVANANYTIEKATAAEYIAKTMQRSLRGSKTDHEAEQRKNSKLGKLGEAFVLNVEVDRITKQLGVAALSKLEHTAETKGDGLGYDIRSVDTDGKEVYIEVKTTKGNFSAPFYITANELLCSEKYTTKYRLYRVYNFDPVKQKGSIKIFEGSLKPFCTQILNYKVALKKKQ